MVCPDRPEVDSSRRTFQTGVVCAGFWRRSLDFSELRENAKPSSPFGRELFVFLVVFYLFGTNYHIDLG